jgi:hypothetical protein
MAETDITGAFGSVKSEKGYLSSRLDVQSARTKLFDANRELTLAQRAFADISSTDTANYQRAADAVKAAQAKVDTARQEVGRVESIAKSDYRQAKSKIDAKKDKAESGKIQDELDRLSIQLQRAKDSGQSTLEIETKIKDFTDRKNKTGKYAPPKEQTGTVVDQQQTGTNLRNYGEEVKNAGSFIYGKNAQGIRDISRLLKDANFYKGPITDRPNNQLVEAYIAALQDNSVTSTYKGTDVPFGEYIADRIRFVKETGTGAAKPTAGMSFSSESQAAARIETIFKTELGRMPTPAEVEKYTKRLMKEERKPSSFQKYETEVIGGVKVRKVIEGLDKDQFLTGLVRKLPEYDKRKAETRSLTIQSLQGVANDNGITLSPQQLDQYAFEVQNGKDVKVIQSQIRALAGLGMPDNVKKLLAEGTDLSTVYSPYKKAMAAVLEINPETISLSDPVLRSAIGPNGEMSLYEYQRSLRKDPRWQYTNNAREDVSTAALQVLRDFGFQG